MRILTMFLCLILAACSGRGAVIVDRPTPVSVPVQVPCVAGPRPDDVEALKAKYTAAEWRALTVKQKAELVAAQALRHKSYGQAVNAATGACQ